MTRELDVDIENLIAVRHDLHAHPQLMFEETYASELVQRRLGELGIEFVAGLAKGTGVLGYLPATKNTDTAASIALRADMDALPILEETGKPYASQFPGKMHACGHDGHTTILLGAAEALSKMSNRANNVLFLFQPAEEGGAGGRYMTDEGCLNGSLLGKPADMIFGLHGWTTVKLGHVATRVGPLMAATNGFTIELVGQGGHAASPQLSRDPIVAAAHLVVALQSVASRNVDPFDSIVVTVAQFKAGTAQNVIPMSAWLNGTVRTMTPATRSLAEKRIKEITNGIAQAFGMEAKIEYTEGYPVVVNHPEATARFLSVARSVIDPSLVCDDAVPTMGGEDFAYYGAACPACFFQLGLIPDGQDSYPSVHTPLFDFNDDAIETGVRLMVELAVS